MDAGRLEFVVFCTGCVLLSDGGVCGMELISKSFFVSATVALSSNKREGGFGSGIEGKGKAL